MRRVDKFDFIGDLNKFLAETDRTICNIWPMQITQINPTLNIPQQIITFYVDSEDSNARKP